MKKNVLSLFKRKFIDLSLKNKLVLFFAGLFLCVAVVVLGISYKIVTDRYEETVFHSADLAFSQAHDFTVQLLWPMIYASDTIYYNSEIQEILQEARENPDRDVAQQIRDMQKMQNILYPQNRPEQGISVRLYVDDSYVFSEQNVYFSSLSEILPEFERREEGEKEQFFWLAPENMSLLPNQMPVKVVSLCRRIQNLDDYREMLGAIRISIEADRLDDIIEKANITQKGIVFMMNSGGEIISASDEEQLLELDWNRSAPRMKAGSWETLFLGGHRFMGKSEYIDNTDWIFVALVPEQEIKAPGRMVALTICLIMILAMLAAGICVVKFSDWFTKRMRFLAKQMLTVQAGNTDIVVENEAADEVGMLYDSFNYMISRIRELMQEQYETGKEIKSAELRALQAQINPHFLYNTLDLINWRALRSGAKDVAQIAQKLAGFYRLSLKQGADIVTLEDEIRHVTSYVEIQNYRFENRIKLNIQVPERFLECQVPKIILQPLVENAILHGILRKPGHVDGMITIEACESGGDIVVKVEDDGIGMTQQEIDNIGKKEKNGHGYGVKNIDMRLRLLFGENYGLSFFSIPQKGTVVTIHMTRIVYGQPV